jgi:hypothetical protein
MQYDFNKNYIKISNKPALNAGNSKLDHKPMAMQLAREREPTSGHLTRDDSSSED